MSTAAPSPVRRSRRLAGPKNEAQTEAVAATIEGTTNPSSTVAPTQRTDGDAAIVGLADSVEIAGFKPPRFLWFVLSGGAGDVLMFMLDWLLKAAVLPPEYATPSTCWAISYTASISWRHVLHTFLVFGGTWTSLYAKIPETYAAYTFGIAFSTAMNWALTAEAVGLAWPRRWAFFATLYTTAVLNFFVLKKVNAARAAAEAAKKQP